MPDDTLADGASSGLRHSRRGGVHRLFDFRGISYMPSNQLLTSLILLYLCSPTSALSGSWKEFCRRSQPASLVWGWLWAAPFSLSSTRVRSLPQP
ncbi:uncharacterized protein SCHCODRAFT_02130725 [Schizophyllum commune H4-8]|uniref:uncharacterized protein n=1 Tax=Schizophyllum commune (strain H4-8 / FGSC 9210) TaxID=578458 RepID=UPI00215EE256|nr:uncharacterized protein SCHCODRAFT_02130725 [Schizophyllum commune H4-8]KAI5885071.1 hypothetical protein SCHCODRAFT_02130725 [Schizophyllum commune H4-8]